MGCWAGIPKSPSLSPSRFWRARLWRWPEKTKVPVGHSHRGMARVPLDGAEQPVRRAISAHPMAGARGTPGEKWAHTLALGTC